MSHLYLKIFFPGGKYCRTDGSNAELIKHSLNLITDEHFHRQQRKKQKAEQFVTKKKTLNCVCSKEKNIQ
jgi:hypothetical protein